MGLLPDTRNCRCACAGNAGSVFPVTVGKRSRHASRHVRRARAVMHAGIANQRFPLKTAAGENFPGIPGACATCNFTYLVRSPLTPSTYCYTRHHHCGPAQYSRSAVHHDAWMVRRGVIVAVPEILLACSYRHTLRTGQIPVWLINYGI